jgi:hypothetical protein
MAWFVLVRALFVAAVGYFAGQLQPLPGGVILNAGFGLLLGGAVIAFEISLKRISMPHLIGALIGGGIGLAAAQAIAAALASLWAWYSAGARVSGSIRHAWRRCFDRPRPASATACSIRASSSTGASPTSARPGSWTGHW